MTKAIEDENSKAIKKIREKEEERKKKEKKKEKKRLIEMTLMENQNVTIEREQEFSNTVNDLVSSQRETLCVKENKSSKAVDSSQARYNEIKQRNLALSQEVGDAIRLSQAVDYEDMEIEGGSKRKRKIEKDSEDSEPNRKKSISESEMSMSEASDTEVSVRGNAKKKSDGSKNKSSGSKSKKSDKLNLFSKKQAK